MNKEIVEIIGQIGREKGFDEIIGEYGIRLSG